MLNILSKTESKAVESYTELDKAGIIYPYVAKRDWNSVYRVEAKLGSRLELDALKAAVSELRNRYPYFFSSLAKKNRRFVLTQADSSSVLCENIYPVCRPFDLESSHPLIRVIYDDFTVAIEMFHTLTDGHGAVRLFKALLEAYASHRSDNNILRLQKKQSESDPLSELGDIYEKFSETGGKNVSRFMTKAYQFKGLNDFALRNDCVEVSADKLKAAAKSKGVTLTVFACAVQIAAILLTEKTGRKEVRISVPVDIRRFAEAETARNGALYIIVGVKRKNVKTFDDILMSVKEQFNKELTREKMQNLAYTNVQTAKLKAFDLLPLRLKKFVLNIGYVAFGENQFTSTLTNIGILDPDGSIASIADDAYFILGKQKTKPVNIALSTYNGKVKFMISSTCECESFVNCVKALLAPYTADKAKHESDNRDFRFAS